jgi:hypothetical protein
VAVVTTLDILSQPHNHDQNLRLYVIGTTPERTRRVLEIACALARDLDAKLSVLVAQPVPYPLPLDQPPVHADFIEGAWSQLARGQGIDTNVTVCLCRDRDETVRQRLAAGSIVLIGIRRRWLRSAEHILARMLRRDGHRVILVDTKPGTLRSSIVRMQSSR